MGLVRVIEIVAGIGLLIAVGLWISGGIGWTFYTPTSTRVVNVPAWPFAVGFLVVLAVVLCIDLMTRRAGTR